MLKCSGEAGKQFAEERNYKMLDILSYQELAEQVGNTFIITDLPSPIEVELIAITERFMSNGQESFSLTFRGPRDTILPQRIYSLQNNDIGMSGLFLVPAAANELGVEYEASFNRLLDRPA